MQSKIKIFPSTHIYVHINKGCQKITSIEIYKNLYGYDLLNLIFLFQKIKIKLNSNEKKKSQLRFNWKKWHVTKTKSMIQNF